MRGQLRDKPLKPLQSLTEVAAAATKASVGHKFLFRLQTTNSSGKDSLIL
jgi:hypothetical protein